MLQLIFSESLAEVTCGSTPKPMPPCNASPLIFNNTRLRHEILCVVLLTSSLSRTWPSCHLSPISPTYTAGLSETTLACPRAPPAAVLCDRCRAEKIVINREHGVLQFASPGFGYVRDFACNACADVSAAYGLTRECAVFDDTRFAASTWKSWCLSACWLN